MKKILVFRGGWDGHEPVQTTDMVAAELRRRGATVDVFDDQECLTKGNLVSDYAAVVPAWTMGELLPDGSKALLEAVAAGVGLGGWHGGMCDAFRTNCDYQFMTGGQWVAHPGGVIDYTVHVCGTGTDPIVAGISDFPMHSEQYYLHVDPANEVLATTTFDGSHCAWINGTVMPVVWKRMFGKGRVFYSSLGHCAEDFRRSPQILEIAVRGILWAAAPNA